MVNLERIICHGFHCGSFFFRNKKKKEIFNIFLFCFFSCTNPWNGFSIQILVTEVLGIYSNPCETFTLHLIPCKIWGKKDLDGEQ